MPVLLLGRIFAELRYARPNANAEGMAPMRLRILVLVISLAVLGCWNPTPSARASNLRQAARVLTYKEAVHSVRRTGGFVQRCNRKALRHFRCWARYWFEVSEEEQTANGEWVELPPQYFSVEWPVDVGFKGAAVHES